MALTSVHRKIPPSFTSSLWGQILAQSSWTPPLLVCSKLWRHLPSETNVSLLKRRFSKADLFWCARDGMQGRLFSVDSSWRSQSQKLVGEWCRGEHPCEWARLWLLMSLTNSNASSWREDLMSQTPIVAVWCHMLHGQKSWVSIRWTLSTSILQVRHLSSPNRAMPPRCAMRFESPTPKALAMRKSLCASDAKSH